LRKTVDSLPHPPRYIGTGIFKSFSILLGQKNGEILHGLKKKKKGERFINLFLEIENRPKMMKGD